MNATITIVLALALAILAANAQGPLTPPPGAPAPVMKSLDQIEARTPLVAGQTGVAIDGNGTITISQPGSYYITRNLTINTATANGIVVSSSNVTLDLNGFALICTSVDGGDAVILTGVSNVRVTNGHIVGGTTVTASVFTPAGWNRGIYSNTVKPGLVVTDIDVTGTRLDGIDLSYGGSRVERCSTDTTVGYGIHASSISFCTARNAGSHAINADTDPDSSSVENCFGASLGAFKTGIYAPDGNVSNSRGTSITGIGINARTAINSTGVSNSGIGVKSVLAMNCFGQCVSGNGMEAEQVTNCRGISNSAVGLSSPVATNSYGETLSGNYGLNAAGGTATYCRGSRPGGVAINAGLAIGCTAGSGTITTTISKQLGTP